jgi:hypothetical protein
VNTPQEDLKQRMLDKVNQERSWLKANRAWLVALAVAAVLGFILGHVV